MRPISPHTLSALVVASAAFAGCGPSNLGGTWSSAAAETRTVDGTIDDNGVEQVTSDTTASDDDAHAFVFNGDGTGTVTTRAIYNLVGLNYLELNPPTETPLSWQTDLTGTTLTLTTDDGVSGEWQISDDVADGADGAEVVLERVVRVDLSADQFTTRTTTLSLRR